MGDESNSSSITISNIRSRKGKKPSKGQEDGGNSKGLFGGLMAIAGPPGNILLALGVGIAAGLFLLSRSRKKKISKDFGAFVQRLELLPPPQPAPPIAPHPLSNLTFAVKDIFDVEGLVTGFGNPDWQRTHGPALRTAPAVAALVQAGATCVAKTHMDEMAYSIDGENKHYGTPVNPAVPSRIPGGSSSGSAVAVAAGLVDFALGTDTAGSVRVPAAYCGILGFRPSHGVVSCIGVTPMAQSFDTVGWFARDPNVLQKVGQVLLQQPYVEAKHPTHVIIADDCFSLSDMQSKQLTIALNSIEKTYGKQVIIRFKLGEYLLSKLPSLKNFGLDGEIVESEIGSQVLNSLRIVFQLIQRYEFKTNHSDWINNTKPSFGPGISERIKTALGTSSDQVEMALKVRHETRMALNELLMGEGILIIPTTPCVPPKLRSKVSASISRRDRALTLLTIAGMSGACQATVPVGKHDGCPMAVSFIAKHGADRFLLDTVKSMYAVLQKEAEMIASDVGTSNKAAPRPEAAEAAKERGNVAFKKKDFRTAIDCYTEAIQYDGSNATYYSNRAAAYLAMCSFHQAEADCGKAIELDKKNVKAYLRRGTAREFLGYYKEADEDFRQALVLEPTNKTAGEGVKRLKKLLYE